MSDVCVTMNFFSLRFTSVANVTSNLYDTIRYNFKAFIGFLSIRYKNNFSNIIPSVLERVALRCAMIIQRFIFNLL